MNDSLPDGERARHGVDDRVMVLNEVVSVHLSILRVQCPPTCFLDAPFRPRHRNLTNLTQDDGLGTNARVSNTRVRIQSSQQRKHQNQSISGTSHRSLLPGSPASQTFQCETVRCENRRSMKDMLLVSSTESGHVCEDKSHS